MKISPSEQMYLELKETSTKPTPPLQTQITHQAMMKTTEKREKDDSYMFNVKFI